MIILPTMILVYSLLRRHGFAAMTMNTTHYIRGSCPYGYKFFHIPRFHSTGGGVGVVLNESFIVETLLCGHDGSLIP